MNDFFQTLKDRNEILYYFGWICLLLAIGFLVLSRFTQTQVLGVNAWIKPFKFAASTVFYAWAMGWYVYYLPDFDPRFFNWTVVVLLGFEIVYIAIQAGKGELSHFNLSSAFYASMYSMMAFAASAVTVFTAYIGILFFKGQFPDLPVAYLWGIRLGIFLFVIFAFEGFVMGSRLTHTIGGPDGGSGIPILNWSTKYGDPRISHFIGMHALQVLPLASFYLFKNPKISIGLGLLYGLLALYTLVVALQGKSMFKRFHKENQSEIQTE